jgi:hypothetical protein
VTKSVPRARGATARGTSTRGIDAGGKKVYTTMKLSFEWMPSVWLEYFVKVRDLVLGLYSQESPTNYLC